MGEGRLRGGMVGREREREGVRDREKEEGDMERAGGRERESIDTTQLYLHILLTLQ